jgi:DNA-binding MarR family transcriptional regulator
MTTPELVAEVRRFTRFYTRTTGLLDEKLTHSAFTLTEARVIYELANRQAPVASEIARDLGLDPAYLARLIKKFVTAGLVKRSRNGADARRHDLELTKAGREAFDFLQDQANVEVGRLLEPLREPDRPRLSRAMRTVEEILGRKPTAQEVLDQACKLGLEGLIGKQAESVYVAGRTKSWIKLKCRLRQDFVIAGYTKPGGSRYGFGALVLGVYERPGKLVYAGKVGTGYNAPLLMSLTKQLKKLEKTYQDLGREG